MMLLLKDGIRYLPYEYFSEEELEQMVIEHYKEIFGADALFFDPQIMTTAIGISAKSDGLIVSLEQKRWFILEVELAQHSLHKHIIPQITKFNIAIQQPETKAKIINALADLIKQDPWKTTFAQTRKINDINKYLIETFQNPPTIAIIVDKKVPELEPVCKSLPFATKTTEFKTYTREDSLNVHIHSFEPLGEKPDIPKTLRNVLAVFSLIYKRGKTYDEAIKIASKKLGLGESSLRAMCSRDIGLTAQQLRKILNNSEKIKQLLTQKFPDYADTIKENIP